MLCVCVEVFNTSLVAIILQVINVISSAILIFGYYSSVRRRTGAARTCDAMGAEDGAQSRPADLCGLCVCVCSVCALCVSSLSNGYKSFTTFFTNLLLISLVLYNCISSAYVGLKHELAYSCVAFEPVSYNAVGPNCVKGQ